MPTLMSVENNSKMNKRVLYKTQNICKPLLEFGLNEMHLSPALMYIISMSVWKHCCCLLVPLYTISFECARFICEVDYFHCATKKWCNLENEHFVELLKYHYAYLFMYPHILEKRTFYFCRARPKITLLFAFLEQVFPVCMIRVHRSFLSSFLFSSL